MKKYYLLILAAFSLTSCYRESDLKSTYLESIIDKFDFPQGTSEADEIFEWIYEEYGTKVIYKDFTESDLQRAWLSPNNAFSVKYEFDYISDEAMLIEAAETLRDKVFGLLPKEITMAVIRSYPYIYLMNNLRTTTPNGTDYWPLYPVKALDGIGINLQLGATPNNYTCKVFYPLKIALEFFNTALYNGTITIPVEFFAERGKIDNGYLLSYKSAHDGAPNHNPENYWARQGRLPFVSPLNGRLLTGKNTNWSNPVEIEPIIGDNREVPYFFLYLSLDRNWRSYTEPGGIFENCPRIVNRLNIITDHLKNIYGIDFEEIQQKLYELGNVDVDTSPSRVFINGVIPESERDTYIYSGL